MLLVTDNLQLPLSGNLQEIIKSLIADREYGCVITFRDPNYSVEAGGFHPVEIYVDEFGQLKYITDFALWGMPPYEELVKELDFDFGLGLFTHNTVFSSSESHISKGRDMFQLWSTNFIDYYKMGVYQVEIQEI
jgi:hypothetical protein